MFLRILRDSLLRQKRRKIVVLAAVSLGTTAAASLANVALDVGDRMSRELKAFGANLLVLPAQGGGRVSVAGENVTQWRLPSYLSAEGILKVKDNFWKNNVLDFAPILEAPVKAGERTVPLIGTWFERAEHLKSGERFVTGLKSLNPGWRVEGRWPDDRTPGGMQEAPPALVGSLLAARLDVTAGSRLEVAGEGGRATIVVTGVLHSGGSEESAILVPLEAAWRITRRPGRVSRIPVSALTTPENAFYERLGSNPRKIPPSEFEKWSCTPFPSSIAYELQSAVPGSRVQVVRRVADSEGRILRRISSFTLLLVILAGLGAALAVTSALTASVLERRLEFGLLKALGAGNPSVIALLLAEAGILGLTGGLVGGVAGALLSRWLSFSLFGAASSVRPLSFPLAEAAALIITLLGSVIPARRLLRLRPSEMLRGL